MRRTLFATAAIAVPLLAHAQDNATNLPDEVVTATRVPTLIEQIPAGVTVIDRATIDARGYNTLVEALGAVPGMHIVQSGGQGGNASAFVRGTDSDQVLVLRDGVPINDPSDPNGAYNFGVDTLGDVDRIEVVRGPMSSLYGTSAMGGVINIITRRAAGAPVATATLATGYPRAFQGAAGLSGQTGIFDYNLGVENMSDRGFDTTPRRESIYTGALNPYRSTTGIIEVGVTPIEGTRISALLRGRTSTFSIDELGFPNYDPNFYHGIDDSVFGRLGVSSTLFNGVWETNLFIARLQTNRQYIEPLEAADPNQVQGDNRYHGRRTDLQWNNTVHLPDYGPSANGTLVVGVEHTLDNSRSSLNESFFGVPLIQSTDASATSNAGHAGIQTTLLHRLAFTADLRQENARYGGGAFTWRAGGVLSVPEVLSRFKATYGTAFHAPSLFDLFGVDNNGYVGNPNLLPERSAGYELGWAVDLPAFGRPDAATIDATYFNTQIRDLIQVVFNSTFTASTTENIASAHIQGGETTVTLRPASWFQAIFGYTYVNAINVQNDSTLLRRPRNQFTVNVRATPLPGLTIAPELIYTSAFQDFLSDDNGFPAGIGRSPGGTIVNMTITYAVLPQVTLFVNGHNLTSSHFEPANGFQTAGLQLLMGVRVRY